MMIKTTKFPIKSRTFSNKQHYAWNFEKAKQSKCREKLKQFQMLTLIFKMKLPIRTVRNTAVPFFLLQNSIYLWVKLEI